MKPGNINELEQLLELLRTKDVLYYESDGFTLNLSPKTNVSSTTPKDGQAESPEDYDVYDDPDLYGGRIPNSLRRLNGRPIEDTDK